METTSQILDDISAESRPAQYAGFWLRFVAAILDGLILNIVYMIIGPILALIGLSSFSYTNTLRDIFRGGTYNNMQTTSNIVMIFAQLFIVMIIYACIRLLYFGLMESSGNQGTLGKMALNLQVTDMDGKKITFWRSIGRNVGKYVSSLIIFIGYIMAGLTAKKQALHDMMANCLVIKKPTAIQ